MNYLKILQWNVRSLPARLLSFQYVLSTNKCSVVLISESWFLPSPKLQIPHFNIFGADRPDGYGGVVIAIHSSLKIRPINIDLNLLRTFSSYIIDLIGVEVLNINDCSSCF